MTVYAYFDNEPLPVTAATAASAAQNNNKQFLAAEGGDRNKRRGSFLSQWAGSSVGNVLSVRNTLRQQLVRVMSSNKNESVSTPAHPIGGAQVGASTTVSHTPATTTTQGKLVVVVTDNGPGISAENQKRLFKEVHRHFPT